MSVDNYINELKNQRDLLADILTEKGVESSRSEKFNTLIPKVRDVGGNRNITGNISDFSHYSHIVNATIMAKLQPALKGNIESFSLGELENVTFEEE